MTSSTTRKLPETPLTATRRCRKQILPDEEIPITICQNNEVEPFDTFDKHFLGLLLTSYKDQIDVLKGELESKNQIILGLLKTLNNKSVSSIAVQTIRSRDETTVIKSDKATQSPAEARIHEDLSQNNWLKDDIDLSDYEFKEPRKATRSARTFGSTYEFGTPLILNNRFAGLVCSEPVAEESDETNSTNSFVEQTEAPTQHSNVARRPAVVAPNHPERGHNFAKNVAPGNSTYSSRLRFGKTVLVVGDSIISRLKNAEFNKGLKNLNINATSRKKFFPGATAQEVKHYITPAIDEHRPDALLIHVGTNNLQKKDYNPNIISDEIINIAKDAIEKGVSHIFISSITARRDARLQSKRNEVNKQLKEKCNALGFVFIDNASVELEHVCDDGVHLLESGLNILANNFLNTLLHFLR